MFPKPSKHTRDTPGVSSSPPLNARNTIGVWETCSMCSCGEP